MSKKKTAPRLIVNVGEVHVHLHEAQRTAPARSNDTPLPVVLSAILARVAEAAKAKEEAQPEAKEQEDVRENFQGQVRDIEDGSLNEKVLDFLTSDDRYRMRSLKAIADGVGVDTYDAERALNSLINEDLVARRTRRSDGKHLYEAI